ncbi:response regulator [Paenibacillus sp. R14(2021)]|uniref:response regulator transcription factor n=1 Tax=Paenibacillus sp. R14(2021) TaxID=2859228 RepID=UPI001C61229E|nr:response regulator [Paenibacillus sp. R14(2021)]
MLNVLLVDDDLPMLSALKHLMDWTSFGFAICGEATNGKAAIEIAMARRPEIVVTDMSMPGMDGTALIAYLAEHLPDAKVIALSGYSDVHYIRGSMKSGAVDYILKHELTAEVMLQSLRAASEQLAARKQEQQRTMDIERQLALGQSVLQRSAVRKLVQGAYASEEEMNAELERMHMDVYDSILTVVVMECDHILMLRDTRSKAELAQLASALEDIVVNIASDADRAYVTQLEEGRFAVLFCLSTNSQLAWHALIHETLSRMRTSIKRQLNLTVSCSVSSSFNGIGRVKEAYSAAEKALSERFYAGNDTVIWPDIPKRGQNGSAITVDVKLSQQLSQQVLKLNESGCMALLGELFERMVAVRAASKTAQMACVELLHIVHKIAKEAGLSSGVIFGGDHNPYETILRFDTIGAMREWMTGVFDSLIRGLKANQIGAGYSEPVRRALDWIRRHYAEAVTMQQAADEIGVNASYLSRLFKEEVKQGFADYVSRYRVGQAKELIRSGEADLKEIVPQTGFSSYNYFFTVFKKITGMTPLEYEKHVKKIE